MKAIYSLIAVMMVLVSTSCNKSEEIAKNDLSFESIKTRYGVEMATAYPKNIGAVPSITLTEAKALLEELGQNRSQECVTEQSNTGSKSVGEESVRKIVMASSYQVSPTRSGSENILLCVELKLVVTPDQIYYTGKDYKYNSSLFSWENGGDMSLSPKETGYQFESVSSIYFRIKDEGDCLVKVPVKFQANYNLKTGTGVYSFNISK